MLGDWWPPSGVAGGGAHADHDMEGKQNFAHANPTTTQNCSGVVSAFTATKQSSKNTLLKLERTLISVTALATVIPQHLLHLQFVLSYRIDHVHFFVAH